MYAIVFVFIDPGLMAQDSVLNKYELAVINNQARVPGGGITTVVITRRTKFRT